MDIIIGEIFNNREKAIIVWFSVLLILALSKSNVRKSFLLFLKTLFSKKIIIIFIAMFCYIFLIIYILYKINIWNIYLLKDTIFWFFGSALILWLDSGKASQDNKYFLKIILENLTLISVMEFIFNFYTFNFWIELIIIPLIAFMATMIVVTENKKEYSLFKDTMKNILAFIGFVLIIFSLYNIISDYHNFLSISSLQSYAIIPLLTFVYVPFLYGFVLFTTYEIIFVRIDIVMKNDKALAAYLKQQIFMLCFLSFNKINYLNKEIVKYLPSIKNKEDISNFINEFKLFNL